MCVSGHEPLGKNCVKCASVFYKAYSGNSSCLKCPDRAACTSVNFNCEAGYEIAGDRCDKCSYNSFKASKGNFACSKCPQDVI